MTSDTNIEPTQSDSGLVSLNMVMAASQMHQIESMARQLERDPTEVVNTALALLAWALAEKAGGRVVASLDETTGSYYELDFSSPMLPQTLN